MEGEVHEVQFTARVKGWFGIIIDQNGSLPFSRLEIEAKTTGSQKRRDISLYDTKGNLVLTGEVKLPWAADGKSPYNDAVIDDARKKAKRAKSPYFFTWNINDFLLWETEPPEDQLAHNCYRAWPVVSINKPAQLDMSIYEQPIKSWFRRWLYEFAHILSTKERLAAKPLDVRFIETIESNTSVPIHDIRDALLVLQKDKARRKQLNDWMRSELGWTVSDDWDDIVEQTDRAAKYACYVFVAKLVFYEALLGSFPRRMPPLKVPDNVQTGEDLRIHLGSHFAAAVEATGDYETVFGEEKAAYGDTVPFRADSAVKHWRSLIEQLHRFDFAKLDYEVIGVLFEKLLTPEERKKYGQYYTRPEVVDLICSFCIRRGDEKVMDPACGGGTFLVRAYARKRELAPARTHRDRLADLFGVDIERFPAHLSTINLAVRERIEEDNYPQVVRRDFLSIMPGEVFTRLPKHVMAKGKRAIEHFDVPMPRLDAVITNPPYIRQEDIGKEAKQHYQKLAHSEGAKLSGRADIHVYFWPHAASFLTDEGYLGLITSSQWLDVEYGFRLQEWILKNFRILALFESIEEPWFEGARVATTVTILQKEVDAVKRMGNVVRFVQLKRPLREVMGHDGNIVDEMRAADSFRNEILGLKENTANERYRARLVRQGELWNQGVRLGRLMGKGQAASLGDDGSEAQETPAGEYFGGKWGMHLRAPNLWFELLDEFADRLVPLSELAEVKRGITSGKDDFFFPIDCSKDCLDRESELKEFKERYGVARKLVESGEVKLVRCGEGRGIVKPIEAVYLEPEVHSLMEISGFTVRPEDCSRMIILVHTQPRTKLNKYAREYIEWGEQQGWQQASTCASRTTDEKAWYDLTECSRFNVIIPKIQQYRLTTILNKDLLFQNCSLLGFSNDDANASVLYASLLNSTWSILSRLQFARRLGNEGNIQLDVYAANMMLVPDPRKATAAQRKRVEAAFEKMKGRQALQFLSERRMRRMAYTQAGKDAELAKLSDICELDMPDRQELDDAVLELLGVADPARRGELLDKLYGYLREFFENTRQKEEAAIANKKKTARRGFTKPEDLASQILDEIEAEHRWLLKRYDMDFMFATTKEVYPVEIPRGCVAREPYAVLNGWRVEFFRGKRREQIIERPSEAHGRLLYLVAQQGYAGPTWLPHAESDARKVLADYQEHVAAKEKKLRELAAERTDDEERQEAILAILRNLILHHRD